VLVEIDIGIRGPHSAPHRPGLMSPHQNVNHGLRIGENRACC